MGKSYKNTILPEIKLKYFKRPSDVNSPDYPRTNYTCYKCRMKNIPFVGGIRDGYSVNPKYLCEDCAIDEYMVDFGFETREAAASWRRRIFDVGYLLNELILERYAKDNNKNVDDLSDKEWRNALAVGNNFYNTVSKTKKERLEAIPKQEELEKHLQKLCKKVKF